MKLGVIADTHNYFDLKNPASVRRVDHILHAGDIGMRWVHSGIGIHRAGHRGSGEQRWGIGVRRETEVVALGGLEILVHHIVDAHEPSLTVAGRIRKDQPDLVVFGHSHKPFNQGLRGGFI